MGSPPFAVPVLQALIDCPRHELAALVTPPDRPRGRGRSIVVSPLVQLAQDAGIPVLQPATTKDAEFEAALRAFEPDVLLVASYGELLRQNILDLAPHGALNVHGSLLPRWRGASPVQAAILAGDSHSGISIQRMVLALDAGDILCETSTPIGAQETAGELAGRLAQLGGSTLVQALDLLESGKGQFTPQDANAITHCRKIKKDEGRIDFARSTIDIERLVRAMNPWPSAFCYLPDGRRLAVLEAQVVEEDLDRPEPGFLMEGKSLRVACSDGVFEFSQVKPQGKGAMDGESFLRGSRLPAGTRLSSFEPIKPEQSNSDAQRDVEK